MHGIKPESKLARKANAWLTSIKNNIFDSERAEKIPRIGTDGATHTSVQPSNSSKSEGFSIYGKDDDEPNFSFFNGSEHNASKMSHLFVTNTIDTSTTEGDGTEIILDDLAKELNSNDYSERKRSFLRTTLASKSTDEFKQSETEQNMSTWSYNTKNFSLSDIQILVDDADDYTDASNIQHSRRTYYMPDTVQL